MSKKTFKKAIALYREKLIEIKKTEYTWLKNKKKRLIQKG
jgi:predicted RNA-binding protein (virulence factor B family)